MIYGRRRVGKTQLLDHWIKQHHIESPKPRLITGKGALLRSRVYQNVMLKWFARPRPSNDDVWKFETFLA